MAELYAPRSDGKADHLHGHPWAEMTKYAANEMLATESSSAEIANLCERWRRRGQRRKGIGSDGRSGPRSSSRPRIRRSCSRRTQGVGARHGIRCAVRVLEAVEDANEAQKNRLFGRCEGVRRREGVPDRLWGLAFKPTQTTCARPASLVLIEERSRREPRWSRTDPVAMHETSAASASESPSETIDAMRERTRGDRQRWNEYRHPDFGRIKAHQAPVVIAAGTCTTRTSGAGSPTSRRAWRAA